MANQVSVKDPAMANQWLMAVVEINEAYHEVMAEAANDLQSIGEFAEGNVVDDLVNFGTDLLNAAEQTFTAINTIAETVKNVLSTVEKFKEGVKDAFGNVVSRILGK